MASVRLAVQTRNCVACGTIAQYLEIHGIIGKPSYPRKCKTLGIIQFRAICLLAHAEGLLLPDWMIIPGLRVA